MCNPGVWRRGSRHDPDAQSLRRRPLLLPETGHSSGHLRAVVPAERGPRRGCWRQCQGLCRWGYGARGGGERREEPLLQVWSVCTG